MKNIQIIDRSDMLEELGNLLVMDARETAVVTIDMHRGHLDQAVATMPARPEDAKKVIEASVSLLNFARGKGIPVIHVVLTFRTIPGIGSEGMTAPFWAAISQISNEHDRLTPQRRSTINKHNLVGSPGTEIIPELRDPTDYIIDNKKRLDCFMGTDLDMLLNNLDVKTICLMGINTNTCVLNTAFTAHNKNYQTVVLSECVASMYGEDLHELGLQNIKRCLGWVLTNKQFKEKFEPD